MASPQNDNNSNSPSNNNSNSSNPSPNNSSPSNPPPNNPDPEPSNDTGFKVKDLGVFVDPFASVVSTFTKNQFGDAAGDYVESAISKGLSGFLDDGLMGGALGLISGIFETAVKQMQEKDEKFQKFVGDSFEEFTKSRSSITQRGLQLQEVNPNTLSQEDRLAYAKGLGYTKQQRRSIEEGDRLFNSKEEEELSRIYEKRGEKESEIERKRQASIRDSVKDMMNTTEFKTADDEMKYRMVELAKKRGELAFQDSKIMQEQATYDEMLLEKTKRWAATNEDVFMSEDPLKESAGESLYSVKARMFEEDLANGKFELFSFEELSELNRRQEGRAAIGPSEDIALNNSANTLPKGLDANAITPSIQPSEDILNNLQKDNQETKRIAQKIFDLAQKAKKPAEVVVNVQVSGTQDPLVIAKEVSNSILKQQGIA